MEETKTGFLESFESTYFYGPHEVHVTVANDTDHRQFKRACKLTNVEPQIIYNETPQGDTIVDLLTVSRYDNITSMNALIAAEWITEGLEEQGLTVIRNKIETTPNHPYAPSWRNRVDRPDTYFESHIVVEAPAKDLIAMNLQGADGPVLISTSDNKRRNGQSFATYRQRDVRAQDFYRDASEVYDELKRIARVGKFTTEFALYDSNPHHDQAWIGAYQLI